MKMFEARNRLIATSAMLSIGTAHVQASRSLEP